MAGPDLSAFGDPPSKGADLSAFGSDKPGGGGFFDDLIHSVGSVYGPGAKALSDSVEGQADVLPALARAIPRGAATVVKGVGAVVDAADQTLMSPDEREAYRWGQKAIGPAPTMASTVAPLAKVLTRAHDAIPLAHPDKGTEALESLASSAVPIAAATINPLLGAAAFGAQGAESTAEDAAARGVAGTPKANTAILLNAGAQSALGALTPTAIAGRLVPQLSKTTAGRFLSSVAGDALLGAAMPAAENTIARTTYDPKRNIAEGVPESAVQMALFGGAAHMARAGGEAAPEPREPARATPPDLSAFGEPANDASAPGEAPARPPAPAQPEPAPAAPAAEAAPPSPAPTAPTTPVDPLTARALDVLRTGAKVQADQGPSLLEFLSRNGGVQDTTGDLTAMDADRWHRDQAFRNRLIQPTGRSIEDAAQAAHEAGYFPEVPPPTMDGSGNMQAVAPDTFLSAVRDELFGSPRYAKGDPHAADLAQHVDDLDQITQELGLDPKTLSDAQIQAAINDHFRHPDQPVDAAPARKLGAAASGQSFDLSRPWPEYAQAYEQSIGAAQEQLASAKAEAAKAIPDTRGQGQQYHGARGDVPELTEGYYNPDNIYGGHDTFYTTDALDVAKGYGRKRPNASIYRVEERAPVRMFDMEEPRTQAEWERLLYGREFLPDGSDAPRGLEHELLGIETASHDNGGRANLRQVMDEIRDSSRGEGYSKDDVQEMFDVITQRLQALGYGGMRHLGGLKTGRSPHNVQIYLRPHEQLSLERLDDSAWKTPEEHQAKIDAARQAIENVRATMAAHQDAFRQAEAAVARDQRDGRLQSRSTAGPDLSAYGEEPLPGDPLAKSGSLREAPQPGAVPAADPRNIARLDATVAQLADDLRRTLGLTHRQGRLSVRVKGGKALGEFDPKSGVVRTKAVDELDVLSHEAFHHLEYQKPPSLMAALKAHAKDLAKLAYPGASPDALRQEGFAEFGRWYLTNPDYARKVAPRFYDAFETALAKDNPKALKGLRDIQAGYQAFLKAPSAAAVRSTIVRAEKPSVFSHMAKDIKDRGFGGAVDKWTNDLYRDFIDDLHPVNQAVRGLLDVYAKNKGKPLELPAAKNPYALARMSRGAYSSGHVDALYGVVPYHGVEPEGPGLQDALHKAFGGKWSDAIFDDFGAYLASRRLVHEWDRFDAGALDRPPDKLSKDAHVQAIADFEAAHPEWRDAAAMVHAWAENMWRKKHEGGLISESTYLAGLHEQKDYVPLMRDLTDKERTGPPRAVNGNRKFSGGGRKFRGSSRDIVNPIQSLMQDAYNTAALLHRNDAIGALYDLGKAAGNGSGAFVEQIPAHEFERITVGAADALEKAAEEIGLSKRDADMLISMAGDAQLSFYRPGEINERGEPIIYHWANGQKTPLRLPDGDFGKAMFDALTGMNRQTKNLFVQVFSAPSRLLRLGVTTQPEFFFANYIRDQIANWITTDVGFKPFVSGARGIADELAQGDLSRRYNSVGGIVGGGNVASLEKGRVERDIKALNQRGYKVKRFLSIKGAIHASEISETGTRLAVFRLAEKQAKARGLNDWDAAVQAAWTARDLLDFDRRGSRMLSAVRTVTFLNASLQGLDKARRVLGAEGRALPTIAQTVAPWLKHEKGLPLTDTEKRQLVHAGKAWAKVAALGAFGLALTAHYADDPEYQEISNYLRATHWMFKVGGGTWLAVPKPFELATLSNILERGYEGVAKHDPKAWQNLFDGLGQILVPPTGITAIAVPFDIARNRSSQGQPIVPDYLRDGVEPELQFNSYTSEFSKRLGKALHLSPAIMDYLITGFGGSWGRTALGASDLVLKDKGQLGGASPTDTFVSRRFMRDVTRGSTSSKEFWDRLAQAGGDLPRSEGTFREYVKTGDVAQAQRYFEGLSPTARSYVAASVILPGSAKQAHPLVGALERERLITELRRDISQGDIRGPDLKTPLRLTPQQRQGVEEALAYMSMATMRDGLVASGDTGWAQKEPISPRDAMTRLFQASPAVATVLRQRIAASESLPDSTGEQAWALTRKFLESPQAGKLAAEMIKMRSMKGKAGVMNFLRTAPATAASQAAP